MTLTLAWVRTYGDVEELVVASDSRLRPFAWDAAPKIMPLPRGDSVIAFAGDTLYAYPMMLQVLNTVPSWDRSANRSQPLEVMKGHLVRVLNRMLKEFNDLPPNLSETPDAYFLLAGFSWKSQKYCIWTLYFDPNIARFTFRPATRWRKGNSSKVLALVGDNLDEAKSRITELLRRSRKLTTGGFDMEPLQVLMDMIDSGEYPSIGGNVQLAKVYRSLRVATFVVERHNVRSLFGRPLLDYEKLDRYPVISI